MAVVSCFTLAFAGCGSLDYIPYIGDGKTSKSGAPKNATRYLCKSGQSFYVRLLNSENAAWLIFPNREVRFEKSGDRYTNGSAALELKDSEANIVDGSDVTYKNCKPVDK